MTKNMLSLIVSSSKYSFGSLWNMWYGKRFCWDQSQLLPLLLPRCIDTVERCRKMKISSGCKAFRYFFSPYRHLITLRCSFSGPAKGLPPFVTTKQKRWAETTLERMSVCLPARFPEIQTPLKNENTRVMPVFSLLSELSTNSAKSRTRNSKFASGRFCAIEKSSSLGNGVVCRRQPMEKSRENLVHPFMNSTEAIQPSNISILFRLIGRPH